jgi:hypothetical protein
MADVEEAMRDMVQLRVANMRVAPVKSARIVMLRRIIAFEVAMGRPDDIFARGSL